ncbi:hypothetical protein HO520_10805 [Streptococcus suis]|nr:hypothetical protein [Streptococcus suis]
MKKEIQQVLKISVLFFSLFVINILVFKTLMILGLYLKLDASSYLFPPLFSTIVLVFLENKRKFKN